MDLKNVEQHIATVFGEMHKNEQYVLEHANLPVTDLVSRHKKQAELQGAWQWLQMIHNAHTQKDTRIVKPSEANKLQLIK